MARARKYINYLFENINSNTRYLDEIFNRIYPTLDIFRGEKEYAVIMELAKINGHLQAALHICENLDQEVYSESEEEY